MKVVAHPTISEFWQVAGALFTADPVRNTVALTVLSRLLIGGRFSDTPPIFLTVHETGTDEVIGAALCTPPFPLAVSGLPVETVDVVADHLVAAGIQLRGISGMRTEVEAFVAAWAERTGVEPSGRMCQRLYELGELKPPVDVLGAATEGTVDDVGLLARWRADFLHEVGHFSPGDQSHGDLVRHAQDSLAAGNGQLIWRVDGEPVSFACVNSPHGGMSRIGPVYTPTECRGHDYGSAVTAAASRWGLAKGAEHVLLFTDLANPVSNSIYQKIGYVPVEDALDVRFT
ncbi:MAG TPA: GNAT family N-acetyltransferase [Pseudonocardiaceae bacterium]|nr:GNAT family N-acetyltransferase [Pseudonocardiaceae bacterium]